MTGPTRKLGRIPVVPPPASEAEERLFLASCALKRLQDAVDVMKADPRVTLDSGPHVASVSFIFVSAVATPAAAARELAARFNVLWSDSGPVSLATAAPSRDTPSWWLRLVLGPNHAPADRRWQSHSWPIRLVEELTSRGVPTDGVRLSKQGDGVWLAGFGGTGIARRAAAAVRLEGSFRASPGQALYGLGPIKDPGEVMAGRSSSARGSKASTAAGPSRSCCCGSANHRTATDATRVPRTIKTGRRQGYLCCAASTACHPAG